MKALFLVVAVSLCAVPLQARNTWTRLNGDTVTGVGCKNWSALVYSADSNRFFSTLGWVFNGNWDPASRYSDLCMHLSDPRWINFLPHDSLYGKWADSTGGTRSSAGRNFEFASFKTVEGYLRPAVYYSTHKAFYQYAYDSDSACIYYYLSNRTIRYDTRTRRWDTLTVPVHPAGAEGGATPVIWGSMCYDPHNKEVLLFGGADADVRNGDCGTWVYKPSANTWTRLDLAIQPPPRCLAQMAYDAKNNVIILFGGDHLDQIFADTWVYDCAAKTWSEKKPAISPSPRAGHALVYLPKSRFVVLMGGFKYTPTNMNNGPSSYPGYSTISPFELWRYDAAANEWKLLKAFAASDTAPAWRFHSVAAADTGDRIIALGDSAMYNGWIKITYRLDCDPSAVDETGTIANGVPAGTLCRMTHAGDPAWFDSSAAPNPDSLAELYRTLPLNTWVRMTPPRSPYRGRDWGTRVLSPDHDCMLVWSGGHSAYCGSDVPQYYMGTDRWKIGYSPELMLELNGDGGNSGNYCNMFTFNNRPFMTGHSYRNYCYSSVHKKMVKHHPSKYTFLYDPVRMDWDTAKVLNPSGDAGGIYHNCLTNTPHGAFGWIRFIRGCCTSYFDFYLLDSTLAWKKLPIKGDTAVPAYYCEDGNALYDSKRDRMLIVSSTERGQVWEYRFSDSTMAKLNPTGDYDAANTYWREGAYLPAQDKLILMGNGRHRLYNCAANTWELLTVAKGPGVGVTSSVSSGYAYDPKRDLVWDIEQHCEVYVMRVAGGYNPDSLRMAPEQAGATTAEPGEAFSAAPVPFNPSVRIHVSTRGSAPVSVRIFDLRGRLVHELLDNARIGKRAVTLTWHGEGAQGINGSAVYLVKKFSGSRCVSVLKVMKVK